MLSVIPTAERSSVATVWARGVWLQMVINQRRSTMIRLLIAIVLVVAQSAMAAPRIVFEWSLPVVHENGQPAYPAEVAYFEIDRDTGAGSYRRYHRVIRYAPTVTTTSFAAVTRPTTFKIRAVGEDIWGSTTSSSHQIVSILK